MVTPNEEAVGEITMVSTSYDASDGRNSGARDQGCYQEWNGRLHGWLFFLYDEAGLERGQ